jgi:hypothetical protein
MATPGQTQKSPAGGRNHRRGFDRIQSRARRAISPRNASAPRSRRWRGRRYRTARRSSWRRAGRRSTTERCGQQRGASSPLRRPTSPDLRRFRGRKPIPLRTMLTWGDDTTTPCFLRVATITTGRGFSPRSFMAAASLRISSDLFTLLMSFLSTIGGFAPRGNLEKSAGNRWESEVCRCRSCPPEGRNRCSAREGAVFVATVFGRHSDVGHTVKDGGMTQLRLCQTGVY